MRRLALVCLLGLGCASKHAGVAPPKDSGTAGTGGPEAGAEVVTVAVVPGCEVQPASVDADPGAVALDCRCRASIYAVVTIYDSTSGAVPTCTFTLPSYDQAAIEFAL